MFVATCAAVKKATGTGPLRRSRPCPCGAVVTNSTGSSRPCGSVSAQSVFLLRALVSWMDPGLRHAGGSIPDWLSRSCLPRTASSIVFGCVDRHGSKRRANLEIVVRQRFQHVIRSGGSPCVRSRSSDGRWPGSWPQRWSRWSRWPAGSRRPHLSRRPSPSPVAARRTAARSASPAVPLTSAARRACCAALRWAATRPAAAPPQP